MEKFQRTKRLFSTCLIVVMVVLIANQLAQAGVTGKISGRVIDSETGKPLPGANVVIEGTIYGAAADMEGDYFILAIPPGTYNVKASMMGYDPLSKTEVRVRVDMTTSLNFSLNPTVISGQEVVVVAERSIVEMGVANTSIVMSGDDIKTLPMLQFKDILSIQMGAEEVDARGIVIRGGRENEISLSVDGMETRDGIDNRIYTRVNPDAVEEVKILTGGFSAQYGNARAGVINIVTKEGSDNYTFTFDVRQSILGRKHFGKSWFERDREIYLSNEALHNSISSERVIWDNTQQDPVTGEYGVYDTLSILLFEGWEARAAAVDSTDPVYGKFYNRPDLCRALYKWRTRDEVVKYGDKPDLNTNVTFGGPVPFLPNTSFFASGRFERNYYLIRAQQDYFQDWGTTLKISSRITPKLKIILTGNYMETSGVNRTDRETGQRSIGQSVDPEKDDQKFIIETPESFAWFIKHRIDKPNELWPYSEFSVSTRLRRQFGIHITHTLSSNTFWDLTLDYGTFNIFGRYDNQKRDTTETIWYDSETGEFTVNEPESCEVSLSGPYALAPQGYFRSDQFWDTVEDITGVRIAGSYHNLEDSKSTLIHLRTNITSQINKYHQVNAGMEFRYMDILKDEYRNYDIPDRHWWQWHVYPKDGAVYLQDKIEFKGMIASLGLRSDFSIPSKWYNIEKYPFQAWLSSEWVTKGEGTHYDTELADSLGVKPILAYPEKRIILSPRLAISHPIGSNAKIFFNYGHYNQLPDPEKRYYFLRREKLSSGPMSVGWLGNPNLKYEKTVQYEVGYSQVILNTFHIQMTAYYRDITDLADQYSLLGTSRYGMSTIDVGDTTLSYRPVSYLSWSSSKTEDVRGLELRLEKRLGHFITGWVNGTYQTKSIGRFGNSTIFQDTTRNPLIYQVNLVQPSSKTRFNINVDFHTPGNFGLEFFGIRPLADISLNLLFWWKSQQKVTYNPISGVPQEYQNFQNLQWKPHHGTDLRFTKRFNGLFKFATPVFYIQILNLFNNKNMFRGFYPSSTRPDYFTSLDLDKGDTPGDYGQNYLRFPEPEPFYLFLNPRQIFIGLRFEM